MLGQRIEDRAFLGLIRKWLKAGILETDGQVISPVTGTPQGGVVSAVLANIYLHYVLDLWFERIVKPRCDGDVLLMRYADDYVCCFQYHRDLKKVRRVMGKRLGKFNLELSHEKTRVIKFTRFETRNNRSFVFLGFEFRWSLSRKNKPLVKMRTAKPKFRTALAALTKWIKIERHTSDMVEIMEGLSAKLLGHFNYYGVSGNMEMLSAFNHHARRLVFKWLNRRSQRKSYNWNGYNELLKHFEIPNPDYWLLELKGACTKRTILKSLVRENRTQGSVRGRSGIWPSYLNCLSFKEEGGYDSR